jgi:hypothetical protein
MVLDHARYACPPRTAATQRAQVAEGRRRFSELLRRDGPRKRGPVGVKDGPPINGLNRSLVLPHSCRSCKLCAGTYLLGYLGTKRRMQCSKNRLLDDFVGDGEQRWGHLNAQDPGSLRVDEELELGRLNDR